MRWEMLAGKSGYIETKGALIPAYQLSEREVVLFDSGTESDPALLGLLDGRGLRVRAVLNTHLHIDHIANNEMLIREHGAEILATREEIEDQQKRGGLSYPVTVVENTGKLVIDGVAFDVIPTPGHSRGHLAYATPDGVCAIGDSMMSSHMLRASKLPYMEDADRAILSMETLRCTDYGFYIAAHKGVALREELPEMVEENIKKELDLYDLLRSCLTEPMEMEKAIDKYLLAAGIRSENMLKMYYVRRTAKARILALSSAGEFLVKDERVIPNIR